MSHNRHHSVSFVDLVKRLPTRRDFDRSVKILQDRIAIDSKIGIVQKDSAIYAVKYIPTPTIVEQREVIEEWELVRDLKLLGYHQLYNDTQNRLMIIIQDYLPCNLLQYISKQNKRKTNCKQKKVKKKCNNTKRLSSSSTKRLSCSTKRLSSSSPKRLSSPSPSPKRSSLSLHTRFALSTETLYPHLKEFESKQIAISVLYKLKKMHKYGFIHCDVKLQNIMKLTSLNKTEKRSFGEWRLIDFTLRTRFNIKKGYTLNSWRGTIGWTAPELVPNNGRNNKIYPASDVWSMGIVILYMVIGQNPFELTLQECKENKLYSLESGKKYWYHHKLMEFKKGKKFNHYLMFLHKKNKISLDLLDLLLNHMLVFDVKKRSNVKTVLKHKWFKDGIKIRNINSQKKFVISK